MHVDIRDVRGANDKILIDELRWEVRQTKRLREILGELVLT